MTEQPTIDFTSFDVNDMEIGGDFVPVSPGKHHASISSVELGQSKKSGAPMLIVDWTVDGEDDADAGRTVRDFCVLFYTNKKTGKNVIHFNIPRYFGAAGQWPTKPADRAKILAPAKLQGTFDKVLKALPGVGATLTTELRQGGPRVDKMGEPVYEMEDDGVTPKTDENGELVQARWSDQASVSSIEFEIKRASKSEVTL